MQNDDYNYDPEFPSARLMGVSLTVAILALTILAVFK